MKYKFLQKESSKRRNAPGEIGVQQSFPRTQIFQILDSKPAVVRFAILSSGVIPYLQ